MPALYLKIFEYYKNQIVSAVLKSGQQMPTEEEICKIFDSSRITTRHALDILATQGYIVKIQGKGTFVSEKKASMQLNELLGFSAEMRKLGKVPSTQVLSISLIQANEKVAEKLDIQVGKQIYVIERIRSADEVKVALEKVSIPFSYVPGLEEADLTQSLYAVLTDVYGIVPKFAKETMEATLANQRISEMLDVRVNSPVLAMERISYDKDGKIYEYTDSIYRGDKYKFTVTMK